MDFVAPLFEDPDACQQRVDLLLKDSDRMKAAHKKALSESTGIKVEIVSMTFDCVTKDEAAKFPVVAGYK